MIDLSSSNEWETPHDLYDKLCNKIRIMPNLDVCATKANTKCDTFFTEKYNALNREWDVFGDHTKIWMNAPNKQHKGQNDGLKKFIIKAHEQWRKHNIPIVAIMPASAFATNYFVECAWRYPRDLVVVNPILPRPSFLFDGKPSEFGSRNSYMSVVWHKYENKTLLDNYA